MRPLMCRFFQEIPVLLSICGQGSADAEGWLCALMYTHRFVLRTWAGMDFWTWPKAMYLRVPKGSLSFGEVRSYMWIFTVWWVGSPNPRVVRALIVYKHHGRWMRTYGFKINMTLFLSGTSNLFRVLLEKFVKLKMEKFSWECKQNNY